MSTSTFPVYKGPWVDFSHGYVQGATLTLTTRDGAFLVSFLTFYITVAGTLFWSIVAFAYHQSRANTAKDDQDGLWNQEQAILRNTGSPVKVAFELLCGWLAWRKVAKRSLRRSLVGIFLALATTAIFSVAGIFAGQVTKSASDNVLIDSAECGYWNVPFTGQSSTDLWDSLVLQRTLADSQYARACYSDADSTLTCGVYINRTIYYTVDANATCPFASGTCMFSDAAAYEMDTGLMDSNDALGLNGPESERVAYRKVTTCAPIHTGQNYGLGTLKTGAGEFEDPVIYLYMGPMVNDGVVLTNYTFLYDEHTLVDNDGYQLTSMIADAVGENSWRPIPELNRTDADVTLMILAQNSVTYDEPSDAPWFSAHTQRNATSGDLTVAWYVGDDYFNNLACTDQHQFCNPNSDLSEGSCTSLTDGTTILDDMFTIGLSELQVAAAGRIAVGMLFDSIYYSVNGRGASALRASETCFGNSQLALPNNQWQIEVDAWFATSLARLQQSMVDYAVGPTNMPAGVNIIHPSSIPDQVMCRSQKIKATSGTQNFSVLGVAIILIVGTVLIVVGMTVDKVVGLAQKLVRPNAPGRLAWVLDEKRQLQRMAFEGAEWTGWQHCNSGIPTTTEAAPLGRYGPFQNQHPSIMRPAGDTELFGDHEESKFATNSQVREVTRKLLPA
ncbi:hypothetical protein LTR85_010843 [Meristemomyces frigidus]|nr:hypothetical protein LTR85_010843 [Meristemomyces frigidus]